MENFVVQYWQFFSQNAGFHEWPTGPFMKTCGGPSIANPPFFVFEDSNVPSELGTEKTGTENYTEGNTFFPRI